MKIDARKLSPHEQREIRMREQGYTYKAFGEAVGLHPRTVAHWAEVAERQGAATAIAGGQRCVRQGERRSLSLGQEVLIRTLMSDKMPDQLKLGLALWTRDAVRELIRQQCSFLMPVRTVGEYLKRWGDNPATPPAAGLPAEARGGSTLVGRRISAYCTASLGRERRDPVGRETGMHSDSHAGRSCASAGENPVRLVSGSRFATHMISTVTNRGKLRFMLYRVPIRFLARLIRDAQGRKVLLMLDNLRAQHSKKVSAWIAERNEQIKLFFLSAYAPELNPDEYLNGDLKQQVRAGRPARNKEELECRVRSVMKRLQLRSQRIRAYFPRIAYAA